ncbi:hypothetical protein RDWZM_004070 [Blomia tropicalis]|uniref:C2H2-type domain-containing protein n=1 Tax=Blomia tropicalis TaxID=40697 RepID=A0A9Q0MGE5_BLOTA|nr:hypothetical protein RDWZM_004070 [Blomia tropicalis]
MVEPIYRLKIDLSSDIVTIKSRMQELQQEIENKAKEFTRLENAVKHFDSLPDMILENDYIHLDNEFQQLYPQNNEVDNEERIQTSETSNRIEVTSSSSQVANDPKKRHLCHICGRAFSRKYHLKRHSTCHSDERPFECEYCGKRFKREDNCRRHGLSHTKNWPYKCNKCDKGYSTPKELAVHMMFIHKHRGERMFKSDRCLKTFRTFRRKKVHRC